MDGCEEMGLCPQCKEHCIFVLEGTDEDNLSTPSEE